MHQHVEFTANQDDITAMNHVADAVLNSFDNCNDMFTSSQQLSSHMVETCRLQYLKAMQRNTITSFLKEQSLHLQQALDKVQQTPNKVSISYQENDELNVKTIEFDCCFVTIGKQGDVLTPASANNISRIHALLVHVTHENGENAIVILDLWSKFGTAVAGTEHASLPDDRRILIVPGNQPFVLHLAVLDIVPFAVSMNMKQCLVCQSAPRTELFETCRHLVACRDCFLKMTEDEEIIECPICRQPVSDHCTRTAQIERGEYETCVTTFDNNPMEEQMDALQSTLLKKQICE